jgi:hypothetical protein
LILVTLETTGEVSVPWCLPSPLMLIYLPSHANQLSVAS